MPMRPNPWYNNEIMARVGQNLAAAIYGDPDARYKQSADDRANAELQLRIDANQREVADRQSREAAIDSMDSFLSPNASNLMRALGPQSIGLITALMGEDSPEFKQWALRNDREHANRTELQGSEFRFRQGMQDDAQSHDVNMAGVNHGYETAAMRLGSSLGMTEAGFQHLLDTDQQDRQNRHEVRMSGVDTGNKMRLLSHEDELTRALYGDGLPIAGSRGYKPPNITPQGANYMRQVTDQRIETLAGGPIEDLPGELRGALDLRISELYQSNGGNAVAAIEQAVGELLEVERMSDDGEGLFNLAEPGVVGPKKSQAQQGDDDVIARAKAAIAAGADPEAVAKRLAEAGYDPRALSAGGQ